MLSKMKENEYFVSYKTNYSKLELFVLDVVCGTVAFILKVIVQSQSIYKNENVFANYVCCHCLTFFYLLFVYCVMSPVSPAAIKKQKQRLRITDKKKKVYREKDKLARETARQIMSPEKKEVQRIKSGLQMEISRKRKCQAESAKEAAEQKRKNRDSMVRNRQAESAKEAAKQRKEDRNSKRRKRVEVNAIH